ncbi:MAG: hypothetical protein HZC41_19705 [Chloroflexi bacterium]|nr:hypothetical protein [Chloroflexota bacterium]
MNLDSLSDKHLRALEQLSQELLAVLRQAKLRDEPVVEALRQLEQEASRVRRERFDVANPEFRGY